MTASFGKRILKWTFIITPWLLALGLAAGWGLAVWTPGYLEKLVPQLAGEMGMPLAEFHIRHAGVFSADVGPVGIGNGAGGLRLNNVRAEYTPASLKQRRVNRIIIDGAVLDAHVDNGKLVLPVLDLLSGGDAEKSSGQQIPPLPFDELVIRDSRLALNFQGQTLSIPFSVTLLPGKTLDFTGALSLRDQAVTFNGVVGPTMDDLHLALAAHDFRLGSLADLLPLPIGGRVDLAVTSNVNLSRPEALESAIDFTMRDADLACLGVALEKESVLSAKATIAKGQVDLALGPLNIAAPHPATLTIPDLHLEQDTLRATFSLATSGVTLPGAFNATRNGDAWAVALEAAHPDKLRIATGGRAIRLGGVVLKLSGTATPESADVILETSTRYARLEKTDLRTGGIKLRLPLTWPAPKRHTPGKVSVWNIRQGDRALGSLYARLRQEGMGISMGGTLSTELLPDLKVRLAGIASMEEKSAQLTFNVKRYTLPAGFDPAPLAPALADVTVTGNLAVEGGVNILDGAMDSRLGVFFTDGSMTFGEDGAKIEGIRLYFESPDILNFQSSPAQMLAFDSFSAGGITLQNGIVTFQLEPGGVTLVERGRFDWCGGHVESRAFRVVPGHDEYDVTLYCTSLRLTELLHQLGLAKARGDSALSGELPVTWRNGKISFHHGFLHSTPGQGGVIQVDAMEDLLDSIPKGTPQRGQLELARAAIKDFEYKWVRIKADTVGQDLMVRLSVDGKPRSTLPFVYRKEFGGFAMVEGDVKGSNFQGLRLDVNFSLPMDRILLYKDIIGQIQ